MYPYYCELTPLKHRTDVFTTMLKTITVNRLILVVPRWVKFSPHF